MVRIFYVYLLASRNRVLYVGITNDLDRRVAEHKVGGFTSRYKVDRLVYVEHFEEVREAIAREKQIKGWSRRKKVALIEALNPEWEDWAHDLE